MPTNISGNYEVVVVGCGGIGSSVLYHAARQGGSVLGLEQFALGHQRGSSHGQTRIIRQAYFEHPNYVPLLREAYQLWHALEAEVDEPLLVETGLLQVGPPHGVVVSGVLQSAQQHHLDIQHLSVDELRKQYGCFRFAEGVEGVFEKHAGYLRVERCVQSHLIAAQRQGAAIAENTQLLAMEPRGSVVELQTTRGTVQAKRVVLTVGAWLGHWLRRADQPLQVLRKHIHWYSTDNRQLALSAGCPLFLFETPQGCYYGFPELDDKGIKVCEHSGGELLHDPNQLERRPDPEESDRVARFIAHHLVGKFEHREHDVCMYTMTRDQHFILDRLPENQHVWLAGGFSGHGFKFASVIGKVVADWVLSGQPDERIRFLGLDR